MSWYKGLKGKLRFGEPLARHTTFKIGGKAKFFIEPKDTADLRLLLGRLKRYKIPFRIIGSGSNILAADKPLRLAIVHLGSPYFRKLRLQGNYLQANSGAWLAQILRFAQKKGFSGFEFMAGIPGTLGGALSMNAGVPGKNIEDLVVDVEVMDYNNRIKTLKKKEIKFGYRKSSLSKYIILGARLKLNKGPCLVIKKKIRRHLDYRRLTQDVSGPSAGCVFRNPQGASAGRLIDLCGLKGKARGKAVISTKHANFIINTGEAEAGDVLKLMALIKKKVKAEFNVTLEPEIKIWK